MATSETYSFNPSVGDIVADVLDTLRITQEGVSASTYDTAKVVRRIDYLLKAWVDLGIPIWTKVEVNVPLIANKRQYTVGVGADINISNPVEFLTVRYIDSTGEQIMLTAVSRQDYQRYSLPNSGGVSNCWYYDKRLNSGILNLYPVPTNSADSLIIDTQRYLQDAGVTTNTLDLPVQWARALMWNACRELLSSYEQPAQRSQYIILMAKESLDLARSNAGEVASLYLYPDTRGESEDFYG